MAGRTTPFGAVELAPGSPYAERAEREPGWHDRLAVGLYAATLAPLGAALARTRMGTRSDLRRIVAAVERHAQALDGLADDELRARAQALRPRLRRGGFEFECVAECFALIRAAASRTLGQRHYSTQLMAGHALLRGKLVEMATGEGKTFCATLPACTVALAGYPVHVITVNDYLARRDAQNMQPLYDFFGLSVGVVVQGMDKDLRRHAYAQSITYATNKELAFDYLRDRVAVKGRASRLHQSLGRLSAPFAQGGQGGVSDTALVLRGLYFAIVDEADSVFVDEARTPLILSASTEGAAQSEDCAQALEFAATLVPDSDYRINAFEHSIVLSDAGRARLDDYAAALSGEWTSVRAREELIRQALTALHFYRRDQHYVVSDAKVQIVDESTGRLMPDRSWERGLHQMIEVKEGVAVTPRRETLARLTYQRLFRRYVHLSGMTGTASEAAREILRVYGLGVVRVPLYRPLRRTLGGSRFCASLDDKWEQVARRAEQLALKEGRAVLIGTRSVRASEQISAVLTRRGIAHALLNAKQDASEAQVIAGAGQSGCVTVATNMAGRGTDIELGQGVQAKGGLHVILTEYHDSRRVDRQLFGRCARQGDPGSCEAVVSLEDEIFEVCVPAPTAVLRRLLQTGVRVPPLAFTALRRLAQWSAERRNAAIRVHNLKHDRQLNQALAFTGRGE